MNVWACLLGAVGFGLLLPMGVHLRDDGRTVRDIALFMVIWFGACWTYIVLACILGWPGLLIPLLVQRAFRLRR